MGGGGGGGDQGVKLTGYLDSPHMLSQYLLIHSEAIKATIRAVINSDFCRSMLAC